MNEAGPVTRIGEPCSRPGDCDCYDRLSRTVGMLHREPGSCEFHPDTSDGSACAYPGCPLPIQDVYGSSGERYVCARRLTWSIAHRGGGPVETLYPTDDWLHPPRPRRDVI